MKAEKPKNDKSKKAKKKKIHPEYIIYGAIFLTVISIAIYKTIDNHNRSELLQESSTCDAVIINQMQGLNHNITYKYTVRGVLYESDHFRNIPVDKQSNLIGKRIKIKYSIEDPSVSVPIDNYWE